MRWSLRPMVEPKLGLRCGEVVSRVDYSWKTKVTIMDESLSPPSLIAESIIDLLKFPSQSRVPLICCVFRYFSFTFLLSVANSLYKFPIRSPRVYSIFFPLCVNSECRFISILVYLPSDSSFIDFSQASLNFKFTVV
jgi:hypothetical protein